MDTFKTFGVALIVAGGLALAYGGFSYTRDTEAARIGPLELTVEDTKTINIPVWAGVLTIALGAALLLARRSR